MAVDQVKLEALIHQTVNDLAASMSEVITAIGHKLRIYRAMAGEGPITAAELTEKIGAHERYVREWLNNQAHGSGRLKRTADRAAPHEKAALSSQRRVCRLNRGMPYAVA